MLNKYIFILFIIAFGYGCQKDDHSELPDNCDPRPELPLSYFTEDRYQFKAPFFNPLNGEEICFYFKDNQEQDYKLLKHNLVSKLSSELLSGVKIATKPVWSRKGLIVFDRYDSEAIAEIWAVRDSGESLSRVTKYSYNFYPVLDVDGENIFFRYSPVNAIPYYFLQNNLITGQVDTLLQDGDLHNGFVGYSAVSNENTMIAETSSINGRIIGIGNLNDSPLVFRKLFYKEEAGFAGLTDLCIAPNGLKSYAAVGPYGIYEIDNTSGAYQKIIDHCWNRRYRKISVSPDGKMLVGELVESHLEYNDDNTPTGNIIEHSSLYLIDLNTLEEAKINIE